MSDDPHVRLLEEQVHVLTSKTLEQAALIEQIQQRRSSDAAFESAAARMKAERDAAIKAAETATKEAKAAKREAADAQKALRDAQGELEDERAFVEATKDKIARLEALEEHVKGAKSLSDLFAA